VTRVGHKCAAATALHMHTIQQSPQFLQHAQYVKSFRTSYYLGAGVRTQQMGSQLMKLANDSAQGRECARVWL